MGKSKLWCRWHVTRASVCRALHSLSRPTKKCPNELIRRKMSSTHIVIVFFSDVRRMFGVFWWSKLFWKARRKTSQMNTFSSANRKVSNSSVIHTPSFALKPNDQFTSSPILCSTKSASQFMFYRQFAPLVLLSHSQWTRKNTRRLSLLRQRLPQCMMKMNECKAIGCGRGHLCDLHQP